MFVSHQCLAFLYNPSAFPAPTSSSPPSVLQLTNLTEIHDQISGMARCPYNPLHNSTALITSSGELYAATAMDFSGRDPAIYRSLGGLPPLRTAQYNSKWLNGMEVPKFGIQIDVPVYVNICKSCYIKINGLLGTEKHNGGENGPFVSLQNH